MTNDHGPDAWQDSWDVDVDPDDTDEWWLGPDEPWLASRAGCLIAVLVAAVTLAFLSVATYLVWQVVQAP